MPSKPTAVSPASSSPGPTPISSPPQLPANIEPVPKSIGGTSKEEEANEMARKKEVWPGRQRIETLKEQKKNVASAVR